MNYTITGRILTFVAVAIALGVAIGTLHAQTPVAQSVPAFIANRGQIVDDDGNPRPDIHFVARMPGASVYVRNGVISYVLESTDTGSAQPLELVADRDSMLEQPARAMRRHRVDLELIGAQSDIAISPSDITPGYTNYYLAHCPEGILHVPQYERILLRDVWPGIDMRLRITEAGLKYDFIVHPGAEAGAIRLRYRGADGISLNYDGSISISTGLGELRDDAPVAFIEAHRNQRVDTRFRRYGDEIRLDVGRYDRRRTLVIDPLTRVWATYLGGNGQEFGARVAAAADRSIYTGGMTSSTTFPATIGAFQGTRAGTQDLFLARFNPGGTRLWATYYGGSGIEWPPASGGIAITRDGSTVVLTGYTASTNFPTSAGAFQTGFAGGTFDAVVIVLDSAGQRKWSTYLGGSQPIALSDLGYACAFDSFDALVIVGSTYSTDFPVTPGAYQATQGGLRDCFVTKFTAAGILQWSTFVGGSGDDLAFSVCADSTNMWVVTGQAGPGFPTTTGAWRTTAAGRTAMLFKLDSAGQLVWSTFFDGATISYSANIDPSNAIVITGFTGLPIPSITTGAFQTTYGGGPEDGFIARFSKDGSRLLWSTLLGGNQGDVCLGLAIDQQGNIAVCGETGSNNFPVTSDAFQSTYGGSTADCFIARFDSTGRRLWATYYGGSSRDLGWGICYDSTDAIIVSGQTAGGTFPLTPGAWQSTYGGGTDDAFLVKFDCQITTPTVAITGILCDGDSTDVFLTAPTGYRVYRWTNGDTSRVLRVRNPGTFAVSVSDSNGCFAASANVSVVRHARPSARITASDTIFCPGDSVVLRAILGIARYRWSTGSVGPTIVIRQPGTYWLVVTDSVGCHDSQSVVIRQYPRPLPVISPNDPAICPGDSITIQAQIGFVGYRWSNGATTRTIVVRDTMTLTVTVTDSNGCRATSPSVRVRRYVSPQPKIVPLLPLTFCRGDSTVLALAVQYSSYRWSTGETTPYITIKGAGRYSVTVTNSDGCRGTSPEVVVAINELPQPKLVVNGPATFCAGDSLRVGVNGVFGEYLWSNGATDPSIIVKQTGAYSVRVRDINGCYGQSDTLAVTVNALPPATLDGPSSICSGAKATYTTGGKKGTSRKWSVQNGAFVGSSSGDTVVVQWGANNGVVELVVTDTITGCSRRATLAVTVGASLRPTITALRTAICDGDSLVLDAGSGYASYRWSSGEISRRIIVRSPGTFTVTVSDSGGCSGTSLPLDIRRADPPLPVIISSGPLLVCDGDTLQLSTTEPFARYQWSTGDTTASIRVSVAGTFSVTVTDTNGCSGASASITVDRRVMPPVEIDGPNSVCIGQDGDYSVGNSVSLPVAWSVVNGVILAGDGTRAISVRWGASGIGRVITTATDGPCSRSDTLAITIDSVLHPRLVPGGVQRLCDGDTLGLAAPSGYVNYLWSTGDTTRRIVIRIPGLYSVAVTSSGGCSGVSDTAIVVAAPSVTVAINPNNVVLCAGDTATLDAGVGFTSYRWSTGDTTRTIRVTTAGNYSVTVTSRDGCRAISAPANVVVVPTPPPPTITRDITDLLTDAIAASYQWLRDGVAIPGANTPRLLNPGRGVYIVEITDSNGCRARSAPYDLRTGASARLTIGSFEAAPGELIRIPLRLDEVQGLSAGDSFTIEIAFDRSLLLPTDKMLASRVVGEERIIEMLGRLTASPTGASLDIGTLELMAALGNKLTTPIRLERIAIITESLQIMVQVLVQEGEFRLRGICTNGGTRLIDASGEIVLRPLRPNPASASVTIEYEIIESGTTRLMLFDAGGRIIPLYEGELTPGAYQLTVDISSLASGVYWCILQTPTNQTSSPLLIINY